MSLLIKFSVNFFVIFEKKSLMRKNFLKLGLYAILVSTSVNVNAQAIPGTLNWYNKDGVGMQTDKAYGLLKKKKSIITRLIIMR